MVGDNGEDLGPETYNNKGDCLDTVELIRRQAHTADLIVEE